MPVRFSWIVLQYTCLETKKILTKGEDCDHGWNAERAYQAQAQGPKGQGAAEWQGRDK